MKHHAILPVRIYGRYAARQPGDCSAVGMTASAMSFGRLLLRPSPDLVSGSQSNEARNGITLSVVDTNRMFVGGLSRLQDG